MPIQLRADLAPLPAMRQALRLLTDAGFPKHEKVVEAERLLAASLQQAALVKNTSAMLDAIRQEIADATDPYRRDPSDGRLASILSDLVEVVQELHSRQDMQGGGA